MVRELGAELLLNLTNALLGDAEGLGTSLLPSGDVVHDATGEDGTLTRVQGLHEGLEGRSDGLGVLGALHRDVLPQSAGGNDGGDGCAALTDGLVHRHTARGHRREALAHVGGVELQMGRDGLRGRIRTEGLLGLLQAAPELLRGA